MKTYKKVAQKESIMKIDNTIWCLHQIIQFFFVQSRTCFGFNCSNCKDDVFQSVKLFQIKLSLFYKKSFPFVRKVHFPNSSTKQQYPLGLETLINVIEYSNNFSYK
jgi:hypothetical protein